MRDVAGPVLFILIWSTGFIVARAVMPHAAPELFLILRLTLTALSLGAVAWLAGETWPSGRRVAWHTLTGALLNGMYLCLAYWAIQQGMPAGIMSLLGSTQPLVIAVAAYGIHGETLSRQSVFGMGVAALGVCAVLVPALAHGGAQHVDMLAVLCGSGAVLGMAAGTMIQRGAHARDPVRISAAIQNAGGVPVAIVATFLAGNYRWDNDPVLWASLLWSVIGLSAVGSLLIVWMTRVHGPTRMSTLLLLVPTFAATEAWLLFGEALGIIQILGFAITLGGVLLARRVSMRQGSGLQLQVTDH